MIRIHVISTHVGCNLHYFMTGVARGAAVNVLMADQQVQVQTNTMICEAYYRIYWQYYCMDTGISS